MKNKKGFSCLLLYFVILTIIQGCKKELDIEYKDIPPITVIEGELTQNGAMVKITMTTPMDEPMDTVALTDASVELTDLSSGVDIPLSSDKYGRFRSGQGGISGHTYRLVVERRGKRYESVCEMLRPTEILAVEFNWIKMPYDYVAVLQVTFKDNPLITGECYWVRLYRNGKAYMWNLMTDTQGSQGVINDVFMTSRMDLNEEEEDTALREGDVITAKVSPISRDMYDYLEAVSSDSNGPLMYKDDFCLGYFLASPVAFEKIEFHPDLIPYM